MGKTVADTIRELTRQHIADNNVHNTRLTIVKDGLDFTHSEVE